MRKRTWIGITILLALAVIAPIPFARRSKPRVQVRAYFQNATDLRPGAPVRMLGIDVGHVTGIHVYPKLRENPVEVSMALNPEYVPDIPSDSAASLSTEGVLGPTFVNIDIRKASGPPLQSGATLKAVSVQPLTPREILDRLSTAIQKNHNNEDNQR